MFSFCIFLKMSNIVNFEWKTTLSRAFLFEDCVRVTLRGPYRNNVFVQIERHATTFSFVQIESEMS